MKININYIRHIRLPFVICLLSLILISCITNFHPEEDVTIGKQSVLTDTEVRESLQDEVAVILSIPVFSPHALKTPIALVNDEPVMLKELRDAMLSRHEEMGQESMEKRQMKGSLEEHYLSLLDRIIASRLIVEEARNIGLDELPEIQKSVEDFSDKTLRKLLVKGYLAEVEWKIPEDEVTRLYRDAIREYNLSSLKFKNKEDAERISKELAAGADFYALATKLIEEGVAEGTEKGENYVKSRDLLPHALVIMKEMKVGEISPVVQGGGKEENFVIFKIENVRYPEDPDMLEQARQRVMEALKEDYIRTFVDSLVKKYATLDKKLLKSVDFDVMKKNPDALNDDGRVVATVEGEEPVTVGDIATFLKEKHFHGIKTKAESLNEKILDVLLPRVEKKVLKKESLRLCFDKSDEFQEKVKKYENGLLFGYFIDKVVAPDIRLTLEEVEAYYSEHQDEFMAPEMIHIDSSLVFTSRHHAENAVMKLREGTDWKWLSINAEGQTDKNPDDLLNLRGRFLTLRGLPTDVQEAVAGAKKGQAKVYESPEGDFYVLNILDRLPSQPQPFDNVKQKIAQRLHSEKIGVAVDKYVEKLKDFYDVEIFISGGK